MLTTQILEELRFHHRIVFNAILYNELLEFRGARGVEMDNHMPEVRRQLAQAMYGSNRNVPMTVKFLHANGPSNANLHNGSHYSKKDATRKIIRLLSQKFSQPHQFISFQEQSLSITFELHSSMIHVIYLWMKQKNKNICTICLN